MVNPYAELKKDPEEVRLVPIAFEEKLLEAIACFEVFAFVEECDAAEESRIVGQFHLSDRN